MDGFFVMADRYAQSALHDHAYSAMPDAPVLPYVEPKRRVAHLLASMRTAAHRPRPTAFRPVKATDCQAL